MDKNSSITGIYKDYVIAQAGNILGIALCTCAAGKKEYEDKNIETVNQYLNEYDSGTYYEDEGVRRKSYELFIKKNMPELINIMKSSLASNKLDRKKWFPIINSFIAKANEYIEEGKVLVKN